MGIRCSCRYGRICLRDGGRRRNEAALQLQRKHHHAAGLDFGLVITFITVGVLKISMVYILPIVGIPLSFWRGTDSLRKGALGHDTCLICRTILPLHAAFADRDRRLHGYAPGMYSYLVDTAGLLTPETFAKTVAFGQSLPGPNVLVAAVLGWAAAGPLGALATFGGTSIPFSLIAVLAGRYIREHASSVFVKSYKAGMAPVAVGLLFATAYLLLGNQLDNWRVWTWAAPSQLLFGKLMFPSFF